MADEPVIESIYEVVRRDLDALVTTHPMGESLAAQALALARRLDGGEVEDKSVAGINRELRETLNALADRSAGDADDLADELSRPTEGDGG